MWEVLVPFAKVGSRFHTKRLRYYAKGTSIFDLTCGRRLISHWGAAPHVRKTADECAHAHEAHMYLSFIIRAQPEAFIIYHSKRSKMMNDKWWILFTTQHFPCSLTPNLTWGGAWFHMRAMPTTLSLHEATPHSAPWGQLPDRSVPLSSGEENMFLIKGSSFWASLDSLLFFSSILPIAAHLPLISDYML